MNMSYAALIMAVLVAAVPALADQQSYPFKLAYQTIPNGQVVMAQNNGDAPILATVQLKNPVNAVVDHPSPIEVVVKPKERLPIATIHSADAGQKFKIAISYKFSIGDPWAIHDPAATYRLPFQDGQTTMVGQVAGGRISTHTDSSSRFAVDFVVPIGTPVLAARSGRVVDIDQGYTVGGNDPKLKPNHILILHEDGTLGIYSHMSPYHMTVSFGQRVEAGTLIGYSGNTGYSSGPHLHFAVLVNDHSADGSANYHSVPATFVNDVPNHAIQLFQDQKLVTNYNGRLPVQNSTNHFEIKEGEKQMVVPVHQ
jgi:murein DD-endopeptidase MepM/ murein hydrolase activator NlpD